MAIPRTILAKVNHVVAGWQAAALIVRAQRHRRPVDGRGSSYICPSSVWHARHVSCTVHVRRVPLVVRLRQPELSAQRAL